MIQNQIILLVDIYSFLRLLSSTGYTLVITSIHVKKLNSKDRSNSSQNLYVHYAQECYVVYIQISCLTSFAFLAKYGAFSMW